MKIIYTLALSLITIVSFGQTNLSKSFSHNGVTRYYRVYIPSIYNSDNPAPLVFNFHGYGSNNTQQEGYGDFRAIADTAGFILVHPNGTIDNNGSRHWNVFGTSSADDIGFISALIDTLNANYNIDLSRVYSTGMSNGGFFGYELACKLNNRFAAIASVTGSMTTVQKSTCNPGRAVPVLQIHGTDDATVPYNGNSNFLSMDALTEFWRNNNGCGATPVTTTIADIDPNDNSTVEKFVYDGCNNGASVVFYKMTGATHTWPGSAFNTGVTNYDINGSIEIWNFFRNFFLSDPLNVKQREKISGINIFPVPFKDRLNFAAGEPLTGDITIMDLTGKIVLKEAGNSSIFFEMNTSELSEGFYIVTCKTSEGVLYRQKIIKRN
jgi:polyhydroxybutyrate depolymerase